MNKTNKNKSFKVHRIVEYIRCNGEFACDVDDFEERGIQDILQQDLDIFETFTSEELQELNDELQEVALQNEIKEAKHLINKLKPEDEGHDLLHSKPENIYGKRTTYPVYYNYPIDRNLKRLPKISYPLKPATQWEMNQLARINKLLKSK